MTPADLVAVATIGSTLDVLTDFTADRDKVAGALGTLALHRRHRDRRRRRRARPRPTKPRRPTDDTSDADAAELDMFNNDVRLRALKTLAEALSPIEQKKAILYFSAGMQRSGQDNQVELRSAINAAVRANVAIYPVDTRGLQAVVPGGDARQASGRGTALFSGRGVAAAVRAARRVAGHADVARGRHRRPRLHRLERFRRGVRARAARHVGLLPARLQQHEPDQGRPVPPHPGPREARRTARSRRAPATTPTATSPHTVADRSRDAARRSRCSPRCRRPTCRSWSPAAGSGWPRTGTTCRSRSPSPAPPCRSPNDNGHGVARRARHRAATSADFPVGRIRETLKLPPGTGKTLAGKQVLYQSGVTLPPGRFSVKVVVRENTQRADGIVRGADRRARAEAGADEGQLGRAQHAAAAGGEGQDRQPARARRRRSSSRTSRTSSAGIRSCSSTTRSTIPARPTAHRRSSAPAWRSIAAR